MLDKFLAFPYTTTSLTLTNTLASMQEIVQLAMKENGFSCELIQVSETNVRVCSLGVQVDRRRDGGTDRSGRGGSHLASGALREGMRRGCSPGLQQAAPLLVSGVFLGMKIRCADSHASG